MSSVDSLEEIAGLLPRPQRERFLLMCARFRNVPEDDEYLLILEAIGLMTLLWKTVPDEIAKVLKGASLPSPNNQQLETCIEAAVAKSVLSYEDLKSISERFEEHDLSLKRTLSCHQANRLGSLPRIPVILAFCAGLVASAMLRYMANF